MKQTLEQTSDGGEIPMLFLLKTLLFSYILTGALLALLAFLLFRLGLNERVVSVAIIAIYVGATFFAGLVAGKRMKSRKFLWGLLMGSAYFIVLAVVSILMGKPVGELGNSVLTTFVLCAGGGMLGGMFS